LTFEEQFQPKKKRHPFILRHNACSSLIGPRVLAAALQNSSCATTQPDPFTAECLQGRAGCTSKVDNDRPPPTSLCSLSIDFKMPKSYLPVHLLPVDTIDLPITNLITVIDDFLPSLTLQVVWPAYEAKLGNTIPPANLTEQPSIVLQDDTTPDGRRASSDMSYVVTLTDPDAPSRDNPKWSEMCHWIASNVTISPNTFNILPLPEFGLTEEKEQSTDGGLDDVVEYKPPGPPPKTGKHRYVFLMFAPKNGTTDVLHLSKPSDRKHWGTGKKRGGVRAWAEDNGLVPVAANFIYSENKKQ
jgi:phosphatidylethanolamine-binding protein (PEBP) family uncharacterized protein